MFQPANDTQDRAAILHSWAVVELFGHRRLGGFVTEEEHIGATLLRIDIPVSPAFEDCTYFTQYYSHGALYGLTMVSEEAARAVAGYCEPDVVKSWELPKQEPAVLETHLLVQALTENPEGFEALLENARRIVADRQARAVSTDPFPEYDRTDDRDDGEGAEGLPF